MNEAIAIFAIKIRNTSVESRSASLLLPPQLLAGSRLITSISQGRSLIQHCLLQGPGIYRHEV